MILKTLNNMLERTPDLLSFVAAPADLTDIDNAALKLAIIRRCGDVEPYYQRETDFQLFGTLWFQTHRFLFSHALDVWNAEYNPIENYDRHESETTSGTRAGTRENTDTHSGTDTTTTSGTRDNTDTHSGTDTNTTNTSATEAETHGGIDTTITEDEIAGFNSNGYNDSTKKTTNLTHGETINRTTSGTNTNTLQHGEIITTEEETTGSESVAHGEIITTEEEITGSQAVAHGHIIRSNGEDSEETSGTRESRIHGNIGVTTAQQMITAELELANKFWLYDYIASAFESENFLVAYNDYFGGY